MRRTGSLGPLNSIDTCRVLAPCLSPARSIAPAHHYIDSRKAMTCTAGRRSGDGWPGCRPRKSWRRCRRTSPSSPPPRARPRSVQPSSPLCGLPGHDGLMVCIVRRPRPELSKARPQITTQQDWRSKPFGCLTQRGLEGMRALGRSLRDLHPSVLKPPPQPAAGQHEQAFEAYSSNFSRTQQSAQGLLYGLGAHKSAPAAAAAAATAASAVPVVVREVRSTTTGKRSFRFHCSSPLVSLA